MEKNKPQNLAKSAQNVPFWTEHWFLATFCQQETNGVKAGHHSWERCFSALSFEAQCVVGNGGKCTSNSGKISSKYATFDNTWILSQHFVKSRKQEESRLAITNQNNVFPPFNLIYLCLVSISKRIWRSPHARFCAYLRRVCSIP